MRPDSISGTRQTPTTSNPAQSLISIGGHKQMRPLLAALNRPTRHRNLSVYAALGLTVDRLPNSAQFGTSSSYSHLRAKVRGDDF
jgi:hypothetical protein